MLQLKPIFENYNETSQWEQDAGVGDLCIWFIFMFQLFEKVKEVCPNVQEKIRAVYADLNQNDLAISKGDMQELLSCTNIVFHCAATVRFDDHLRYFLFPSRGLYGYVCVHTRVHAHTCVSLSMVSVVDFFLQKIVPMKKVQRSQTSPESYMRELTT